MNRTGWLAVLLLGLLAVGGVLRLRWPAPRREASEPPTRMRTFIDDGYEYVAPSPDGGGGPLSASATWTLGLKLKLNAATEEELALMPGVGPKLAKALVAAREARGGFRSWDDVDAVAGVGPAKLKALQADLEL